MRTLILRLADDPHRPSQWAVFDGAQATAFGTVQDGETPRLGAPVDRNWVLVPGSAVTAHIVALPPEARTRELAPAAAFALEDQLAVDPAELHFALGESRAGGRLVCVAGHGNMGAWTARLAAIGVRADLLMPDFLGISDDAVRHDGVVLCNKGDRAFSAEVALAELLDVAPATSITTDEFLQRAHATLSSRVPVNLLQGRYAPRRDWRPVLRPWKRAAALAAGVVIAGVCAILADGVRLNRQAEAASARAEAVFRTALPDVKRVVNPRAQMRAHLQASQSADGMFLDLSEILVGAAAAVPDAEVTTLRFDGKRAEMSVTLSLASFEGVERLKSELIGRGAVVQEGGARQDGPRILADVTVRRK